MHQFVFAERLKPRQPVLSLPEFFRPSMVPSGLIVTVLVEGELIDEFGTLLI